MPKRRDLSVLHYVDENGDWQDKNIHNPIVNGGDHEACENIGREVAREIGISEKGIERLIPQRLPVDKTLMETIRNKHREQYFAKRRTRSEGE